ncbi:hypothetical protein FA15DRAFT_754691 [Coprinopsis marcescibilis]|uniref:T6SS Phospholipase effector Tle1-like catalytic domain-containing protein n=1 Tax=Coprinopsis marcescibilis TaxID=230819 RepID=A0A5C3L282_COPMA|nr:hypothetical protein FA15DRAFT_754691 [Coprinopsis marcescibilis]
MASNQTVDGLPTLDRNGSTGRNYLPSPVKTDSVSFASQETPKATATSSNHNRQDTVSTFQGSPIVPPTNKARTLVMCFDGTGDQFDADNSNIVEFFSILHKGDPEKQLVYYQAGIGTYTSPKIATPLVSKISKALDEAVAWNLDAHVMDGYEFLMQNYRAKDRICIFGFSRGAYTARCLAGMIHKVGLLPTCNHQQVPFAYKMYTKPDAWGWKQSNAFKKAFSIDVDIEFLGVWDTVNSVGLIPRRLPFSTSNNIVRTFRHAIALDERRAKFKANMWNRPTQDEAHLGITEQKLAKVQKKAEKESKKKKKSVHDCLRLYENRYSRINTAPTDVEEVWFSGCHCDVGGGSVSNETIPNLARIPLRWMIRECFRRESGIIFQVEGLRNIGLDPASIYPTVLPRPPPLSPIAADLLVQRRAKPPAISKNVDDHHADDHDDDTDPLRKDSEASSTADSDEILLQMTEEEHELHDALSPKYDQLKLKKTWWIFEIFPTKNRYQRSNDEWTIKKTWNLGRGRVIPRQNTNGAKVHRSVKIRMETAYEDGKKYVPKATLNLDKVIWVD